MAIIPSLKVCLFVKIVQHTKAYTLHSQVLKYAVLGFNVQLEMKPFFIVSMNDILWLRWDRLNILGFTSAVVVLCW